MTLESDLHAGPQEAGEVGDAELFKAVRILREIFDRMGLDVVISAEQTGDRLINVSGPDSGLVVGKKGQTLDALHFILNRMLHRITGKRGFIDMDVEGYRSRREKALRQQALELAARAREEGKILEFDPMNARERRIVHLALADEPGITTRSEGAGEERRVCVIPLTGED
jgi:spoIIIJ-associated protein